MQVRRTFEHGRRSAGPARIALVALVVAAASAPAATAQEQAPGIPVPNPTAPDPAEQQPSRPAPPPPVMSRISDERRRTFFAYVEQPTSVRAAPDDSARRLGRLDTVTYTGYAETVLVLGVSGRDGGRWSYIRYSGLGTRLGWVRTSVLSRPRLTEDVVVLDRRRLAVGLYRRGRRIFIAQVGIGARASPTPGGHFYVRERVTVRNRNTVYGALAFGLSAYSRYRTDWPGGGQVGLHGTNQPQLIPGRISNGCIRLRNRDVLRLDRLLRVGTPIWII